MGRENVAELYKDATVLLTGGTGFLGKVILEKLLRATEVSTIYLLLRAKKGKTPKERLDAILQEPIFSSLLSRKPDVLSQVKVVVGDVASLNLGLSDVDRAMLCNEVNIIFHGAATLNFDENLKLAVESNVRGTRELLDFARHVVSLKVCVVISTAFCNCPLQGVMEKVYPAPISHINLIKLTESLDYETAKNITQQIIGDSPNTYTFTKKIGEEVVTYFKDLPVSIVRPSIVVSTYKEPLPGWTDNNYGPTGIVVGSMTGVLHALLGNYSAVADIVPVDMTVNCILTAAWDTKYRFEDDPAEVPVYNYVSVNDAPLTWRKFQDLGTKYGRRYPPVQLFWYIFIIVTQYEFLYRINHFFLHSIPGFVFDKIGEMMGKEPRFLKIYDKVYRLTVLLGAFSLKTWTFDNSNVRELWRKMGAEDELMFPCDLRKLDWDSFFCSYILGLKTYRLKEVPGKEKNAKTRLLWYRWIHNALLFLMSLSVFTLIYLSTFPIFQKPNFTAISM